MDAGRELDALIAEKVMGLTVAQVARAWSVEDWLSSDRPTETDCKAIIHESDQRVGVMSLPRAETIPHYSADIAAAWEVVSTMEERGFVWYIEGGWHGNTYVQFKHRGHEDQTMSLSADVESRAAAVPLAICLAALKAVDAPSPY